MIPIEYQLDDTEEKEYIEKVLNCMDTPEIYGTKLIKLLEEIAKEKPQIKVNIMNQAMRFSVKTLELKVLYAWLVMPYKNLEEIKKYIEERIKRDLVKKNSDAVELYRKFTTVKSFQDLKARRNKYDYVSHPGLKEIIQDGIWYDPVYRDYEKFKTFYSKFSDAKINNWIVAKVDMKVCPYCNIAYTYSREKSVTAQLDHFFPKSEYPMFALCFFNLIPACPACNRIKHDNLQEFASPYKDGVFHDLKISWEYEGKADDERYDEMDSLEELEKKIEIKILTPELSEQNNISGMRILEAYQQHKDYAGEVIKRVKTYSNPEAQKLISGIWEPEGISSEEITRFYFGNYLNETELKKRPLSKMTRDFLEEYKKITNLFDDWKKGIR